MARALADHANSDRDWRPCPAEDLWPCPKANAKLPTRTAATACASKAVRATAVVSAAAIVRWRLQFQRRCSRQDYNPKGRGNSSRFCATTLAGVPKIQ